jgi:exopolysaccharide biosynthesis polyprenyl glycosylphosphotransferase
MRAHGALDSGTAQSGFTAASALASPPSVRVTALTAAGAGATAVHPGAAVLTPPLRIVEPLPSAAPRTSRRSAGLTWLLDGPGWPWLRATFDVVSLLSAIAVTSRLQSEDMTRMLPFVPLVLLLFWLRGMYRRRVTPRPLEGTISVASGLAIATMALAIGVTYTTHQALAEMPVLHLWIFSVLGVVASRAALLGLRHALRVLRVISIPTLILGAGRVGDKIGERISSRAGYGLEPLGFLDSDRSAEWALERASDLPVLGSPEEVEAVAARTGAEHVVISFARERDHDLVPLIRRCTAIGLDVSLVPRLFESINDRLTRESVGPLPLYVMQAPNPRGWEFLGKNLIDRTAAALGLLLLAPLLGVVALAVKLSSPGPVLFRQRRIGRDGQVFELLKFRSMQVGGATAWTGPVAGQAPGGIEGVDRRTPIGRFLRRSSIDELPQLWNVLRGDMSLVGPRPERPEFVEQFGYEFERYHDRHRVKSGITGWAQVNGLRGKTELEDRIEWDNYYIENWSLALDFKILARTVVAVFRPAE